MAFWLKIKIFCQRSECASTLDQQASSLPVLSIITLNHLKSGCREGPHIHSFAACPTCGVVFDVDVVLELEELGHVDGDGVTRLARYYH